MVFLNNNHFASHNVLVSAMSMNECILINFRKKRRVYFDCSGQNITWLLWCSSQLEAILDRTRLGLGLRFSSGTSMSWLPKAVLMVNLDPPLSGTFNVWRVKRWVWAGTGEFWIVDVLSTSVLVPDFQMVMVHNLFFNKMN